MTGGNVSGKITVYSAAGANGEDAEAQAVMEYTLKANSSMPVKLHWMQLSRDSNSPFYSDQGEGWRIERWFNPYVSFRWMVPHLCNFKGRAIYVDPDFVFTGDVAELWKMKFQRGKVLAARWSSAAPVVNLFVWNCSAAKNWLPSLSQMCDDVGTHQSLMMQFASQRRLVQDLPRGWSMIDSELEGVNGLDGVRAYHCRRMHTQPYLRHAMKRLEREGREHWFAGNVLPNADSKVVENFDQLLVKARAEGFEESNYLRGPLYGGYSFGVDRV